MRGAEIVFNAFGVGLVLRAFWGLHARGSYELVSHTPASGDLMQNLTTSTTQLTHSVRLPSATNSSPRACNHAARHRAMELDSAIADAFVLPGVAFSGNPAAVVLCPSPLHSDADYAAIAAEFALPETAFVGPYMPPGASSLPTTQPSDPFTACAELSLRWFTPTTEVALCGHATLAAAHVLVSRGNAHPAITFHTRSGPLTVTHDAGRLSMRFPYHAPVGVPLPWRWDDADAGEVALAALLRCTLRHGSPSTGAATPEALVHSLAYSPGTRKLVVRLRDECAPALASLAPDTRGMLDVDQAGLLQFVLQCAGSEGAALAVSVPHPAVAGISATVRAPPDMDGPGRGAHFLSRCEWRACWVGTGAVRPCLPPAVHLPPT
jgi:predicted PhzF superfamily epimerase YddE/YHI9